MNNRSSMIRLLLALLLFTVIHLSSDAAVSLKKLRVEYTDTPLGIDVAAPRFSWQMAASGNERLSEKSVKEAGKPIKRSKAVTFLKFEEGKAFYELKSGEYNIISNIQ